ncbi:diadenylate cyclase [Acetoanaerobium pronyense]|uniref:DNA integrity scanning protein DisA n=1 Tax=Acetoanaerobium pronyense TaxID=1482736 RepID=A0ABS4KL28_9FIRM|nr:DNA integrity scanning diadenylate cyclase DisA [Acetoanaerobium pronyense]MBP2027936.1 diadenylate cyclase [Acetoanaerobium pronyense]
MANVFWENKENIGALKMLSPGTPLREGLENVLRAKTGALIVIGDSEDVLDIVDGGFNLNSEFSPAYLYELAKMDGSIILSTDAKKILYANAQLLPDSSIVTKETGTRHRTAERVARQTGKMVISISQRRHIITLYKGSEKYIIEDTSKILTKANQAVQTLEKYKIVLDQFLTNLSALEFEELVTLYDVVMVVQKIEMLMRVVNELERYIIELGNEGRLVKMQMDELMGSVKDEYKYIFKDYINSKAEYKEFKEEIKDLTTEDLLDNVSIAKLLGYTGTQASLDESVYSKGYRILHKIQRLPSNVIENLTDTFTSLSSITNASIQELDDVEGIGEIRARHIKNGIRRIKEQMLLDRHI